MEWPPGPLRAEALRLRAHIAFISESVVTSDRLLRQAREEVGADDHTRATIERDLALTTLMLGDGRRAFEHASSSLALAQPLGDRGLLAQTLAITASIDFILGNGLSEEMCARALALERPDPEADAVLQASGSIGAALAIADDFRGARERMLIVLQRARDLGEESTATFALMALAEVEARSGNLSLAEAYAEEGAEISVQIGARHNLVFCRAFLALVFALRGEVERARAAAADGLALAQSVDSAGGMLVNLSTLGLLDLSLGDFQAAADRLAPVAAMALISGYGEPGSARFICDYIEALLALGRIDEARPLVDQLEERGRALNRSAALGAVARFHALILAAEGAVDVAITAAQASILHYGRVELPLELGRAHLAAGEVNRRARRKRQARHHFALALQIFEDMDARLWADQARTAHDRVSPGELDDFGLTPMERRVAELVAEGRSNKEIAAALFIAPKTVEAHLTRIFHKTDVTSRTQLIARLRDEPAP